MNLWEYLATRQASRDARRRERFERMSTRERRREFTVLTIIVGGLIGILLAIIVGLFLTSRPGFTLPNWAENVLVSIATAAALKLGDCIAALVQLATGRQLENFGNSLANAPPATPPAPAPDPNP